MFNSNLIGILAVFLTTLSIIAFYKFWLRKIWTKNDQPTFLIKTFENKKIFKWVVLIISFLSLFYMDFIRDYVFKNLTYRMNYIEIIEKGGSLDKYFDSTDSFMVLVFGNFSSYQLYYFKIVFTVVFLIVYFLICQFILKIAYLKHRTLKFSLLLYGTGFLLMLVVFSFYFFTFPPDIKNNFYLISMELGHFLESSLPTLLLLLSFKIYLSSQNFNQIE